MSRSACQNTPGRTRNEDEIPLDAGASLQTESWERHGNEARRTDRAESDVAVLRYWRNQVDDGAFSGNGRTIKISSDIRESRNACRASPRACRSGAFDGVLVRFRHGP